MKDLAGTVAITVPAVNGVTDNGIITALQLENAVLFGMTYGAWLYIGMGAAVVLLLVERGLSIKLKTLKLKE